MKTSARLGAFFALMLLTVPSFAATFQSSEEDVFSITVPVRDDLYAAGGIVRVKETITGDLVIAGGEITMSSVVTGDMIGAGGRISIDGNVSGDLRVAGGQIDIRGDIGEDLIVFGGQVHILEGSTINGDVVAMGGMIIIDGIVQGNLKTGGGELFLAGSIGGNADIQNESVTLEGSIGGDAIIVSRKITTGEGARITGELEYWTKDGLQNFDGVALGGATYNAELKKLDSEHIKKSATGAVSVALATLFGYSLLSSALVLLVLVLLTKNMFKDTAKKMRKAPWKSALHGVVFLVATPAVGLLLMITIIGIPLGAFVLSIYAFTLVFSVVFTSLTLAEMVMLEYKKKWGKLQIYFAAVGFFFLLKLLILLPVIGWLISMITIFMALGALIDVKFTMWKKVR